VQQKDEAARLLADHFAPKCFTNLLDHAMRIDGRVSARGVQVSVQWV
jgi:hypothetical protein